MTAGWDEAGEEALLWQGRPAWSEYVFLWFFAAVFGFRAGLSFWMGQTGGGWVYGAGLTAFIGSAVFLRRRSFYRLSRRGLRKSMGLLGGKDKRIAINEIDDVTIRQGPLDRLFGIGTVILNLKTGRVERLIGIKNPEVLERKLKALF